MWTTWRRKESKAEAASFSGVPRAACGGTTYENDSVFGFFEGEREGSRRGHEAEAASPPPHVGG